MSGLKIVFFGTPNPACAVMEDLINSEHEIISVITRSDKRRGRGNKLIPTPVKLLAQEHSIDVYTPSSKSELDETVTSLKADVGIVVAYGRIVSLKVLNHFPYGCINVHYSLLPRWRGAAPVERAILAGDEVTGISIMKMDEGLDTGPIYADRQIDILDDTTSETLFTAMNAIAPDLLLLVLDALDKPGSAVATEQVGIETYAEKLSKEDFYFDKRTSVVDLDRKIRAGSFVKGAHTLINGEVFRIINRISFNSESIDTDLIGEISREGILTCFDGHLIIDTVQVPGKPEMSFRAFANGVDPFMFPLKIA